MHKIFVEIILQMRSMIRFLHSKALHVEKASDVENWPEIGGFFLKSIPREPSLQPRSKVFYYPFAFGYSINCGDSFRRTEYYLKSKA